MLVTLAIVEMTVNTQVNDNVQLYLFKQLHHHKFVSSVINECDGIASNTTTMPPCDQICIDTCESYQCVCSAGYILNDDKVTCQGKLCSISSLPLYLCFKYYL